MIDFLQLATLKTISVQEDEGGYTVEAEGKHIPTVCPHCRSTHLHGHGTQPQKAIESMFCGRLQAPKITIRGVEPGLGEFACRRSIGNGGSAWLARAGL